MSEKRIELPCFGVVLSLHRDAETDTWSGSITSPQLKDPCPDCGQLACEGDCPESQADNSPDAVEEREQWLRYNAAIDGIESLVLAHACAGVNVETPAYIEGLETAVNAVSNHFT